MNDLPVRLVALAALILVLSPNPLAAAPAASPASELVVHEWGTFTSLQASDGSVVTGLHHEDPVSLPAFVHSRDEQARAAAATAISDVGAGDAWSPMGSDRLVAALPTATPTSAPRPQPTRTAPVRPHPRGCHGKGCDWDVTAGEELAVTQKMETPVIYFYSPTTERVRVTVGFPQGIITQWYPQASSFRPRIGEVDRVAGGSMTWDVNVSRQAAPIPPVASDSIWAPSRQVPAASFVSGPRGENDKLIFYRGLGRFETPLRVLTTERGDLDVAVLDKSTVPDVFLLDVRGHGGAVRRIGGGTNAIHLAAAQARLRPEPMEAYVERASREVADALVRSGLYRDEAQAMVRTWQASYFRAPGLRLLYVLPRSWTERLLPMTVTPTPRDSVRTLVGRVEIMTRVEEMSIVSRLASAPGDAAFQRSFIRKLDRFAEPKLRRALALAPAALRPTIQTMIDSIAER